MQAPRRIDDDDIIRARLGGGNRIVDYRRRVGAGFLLDDLDADALRPDFQLLDRGGAKRVRGAKHDALSFLAKPVCELPDAGGLARAIDANDENHARAAAILRRGNAASSRQVRPDGRVQNSNDVRLDLALELRGVRERVAVYFFTHCIQNFARRLHTQVSGEKRSLQILEDRKIVSTVSESAALVLLTDFFSRSRSVGSGSFLPKREIIRLGASIDAQS